MADNDHTAVIDVGKTHIKLCVVDAAGATVHHQVRDNPVADGPPFAHFDVDGIWDWLLQALATTSAEYRVAGIVPTTHGAACALVGDDGLLLPILDYEYPRIEEVSEAYEALARRFAETRSPRLPVGHNLGRQLFWLQRSFPEAFAATRHILTYAQYWGWRLTGVPASEVTFLGCHSDLWRPEANSFSSFAREIGWDRLFPPLEPAWHRLGPITEPVRDATGLPARCAVYNGLHDSNASYLRHLVQRRAPFTVVSTGTWVICFAAGRPVDRLDETNDTLANVDARGQPVASARFMGGREFAAIGGADGAQAPVTEPDLRAVLESGVVALPAFCDQGGPFRQRPGRIVGEAGDARRRAALATLYCALMTDHCLSLLDARGDIVVEGSFAANEPYCGLLAALRPAQPAFISHDVTGTVAGAAMLARWPAADAAVALRPCRPLALPGLEDHRARWRALCAAG